MNLKINKMENTLEKYYESLITKYQDTNIRNAPRIGKAVGRLSNVLQDIENNTDLTDHSKQILLRDLKYIYENVNEIEL